MSALNTVFAVWFFVLLLFGTIGFALFVHYRESTVIKARGFWSVVVQVGTLLLFGLSLCIQYGFAHISGCSTGFMVFNYAMVYINFNFILERCTTLYIRFSISAESVHHARSISAMIGNGELFMTNGKSGDRYRASSGIEKAMFKWLLTHRSYFHDRLFSVSKILSLSLCVLWIMPTIVMLASNQDCSVASINSLAILNVFYLLCLAFLLVAFAVMRKVEDNFRIKNELLGIAIMVCCAIVALIVVQGTWGKVNRDAVNLVYVAFVLPEVFLCLYMPVYYARTEFRKRLERSSHVKSTGESAQVDSKNTRKNSAGGVVKSSFNQLISTLEDEDMRSKYEKFLVKEFAVEGLLFWKALKHFKKNFPEITAENKTAAEEAAKTIFTEFCLEDSKLCLNLSAKVRSTIKQCFTHSGDQVQAVFVSITMFDEAEKETLMILCNDSYKRFVREHRDKSAKATSVGHTITVSGNIERSKSDDQTQEGTIV